MQHVVLPRYAITNLSKWINPLYGPCLLKPLSWWSRKNQNSIKKHHGHGPNDRKIIYQTAENPGFAKIFGCFFTKNVYKWDQSKKTWNVHLKAGQFWCQPMEVSWARFDNQADITWIFSKQQVQKRLLKIPLVLLNTFWSSCHDLLCSFTPTKMKASTSTPQRFTPCRC